MSANTVESYVRDIARLANYAGSRGMPDPSRLTAPELRKFVYALKDLGLAATTIRPQTPAIRTYYKFLVGEPLAVRDPSERLESPKSWRNLPTVLKSQEVG